MPTLQSMGRKGKEKKGKERRRKLTIPSSTLTVGSACKLLRELKIWPGMICCMSSRSIHVKSNIVTFTSSKTFVSHDLNKIFYWQQVKRCSLSFQLRSLQNLMHALRPILSVSNSKNFEELVISCRVAHRKIN